MWKKWAMLGVFIFLVALMVPTCCCLVTAERFLETANPKEKPSQKLKDWLQGK